VINEFPKEQFELEWVNNIDTPTTHLLQDVSTYITITFILPYFVLLDLIKYTLRVLTVI
jgi:hypothetical protein